jgi:hypothetical protein
MQSIEILMVIDFDSEPCQPALWGRFGVIQNDAPSRVNIKKRRKMNLLKQKLIAPLFSKNSKIDVSMSARVLLVVFGLQHFAATVETVRADVVTQVSLTSRWLNSQRRRSQKVVCTMHTALRRGLFVLLNSHDYYS